MFKLYWKYFGFLKPYLPFVTLTFLGDVMVGTFALIMPLFTKMLFDYAYPLQDLHLLNLVSLAMVTLFFIEFFINVSSDYLGTYVHQSFSFDLTKRLFDKCQHLPVGFHNQKTAGDLVNRFTSDLDTVGDKVIETIPDVLLHLYTLISILVVAFFINYKITLLALCSIPIYILETKFFSKKEEAIEEEAINLKSDYIDTIHERFRSIKIIKAFGQEAKETETIVRKKRQMNVVGIKQGVVMVISVFSNSVTVKLWTSFLAWYMGYLVIRGELTIGEIVAMLTYLMILGEPIKNLSSVYSKLVVSMVSFRRLEEIFQEKPEEDADKKLKDFNINEGIISFEHVQFAYSKGEQTILNDLSFHLKAKTAVAIVGESGSGKSTIVSLLMRFYSPTKGGIFIDGQKITEMKLRSFRNQLGMVQQDCSLFAGTIRENILYGSESKTEADLIAAAKMAQIYDFISGLELGFDTEIGIGGDGLSGGQKQRIAIARVLLRDPKIIVFDEATSALDPESEYKIIDVINNLIGKKNLFIIAHRLSTIKKVDLIMMLANGHVVEQGSFHELLDKKGAFFRYHSMQFGGFEVFKKVLEIEYERVSRYGSHFNLTCVEALAYQEIHDTQEEELASAYMEELGLLFKKVLRKGDSSSLFFKNIILVLLPEIKEEGVRGFYNRVNHLLTSQSLVVGKHQFPIKLKYSTVHVEATPFKVIDDLIKMTITGLQEIHEGAENFVIQSIVKRLHAKPSPEPGLLQKKAGLRTRQSPPRSNKMKGNKKKDLS